MDVTLTDFAARCSVASRHAVATNHQVLVSHSVSWRGSSISDRVGSLPRSADRVFVWRSQWTGCQRLGIGTALDVTASGPDRFAGIAETWERLRDDAAVGGPGDAALVGGLGFTRQAAALMWLPACELVEVPGAPPRLVLNAVIRPESDVTGVVAATERAVRQLSSTATPGGSRPSGVTSVRELPTEWEWKLLVRRAIDAIDAGEFDKVVLARRLTVDFDDPVDVPSLLADLVRDPSVGAVFGARAGDTWFVGRTPECLVHLHGGNADAHGLAGSLPRDADPARDAARRRELCADAKLAREHGIVARYVTDALRQSFGRIRTDTTEPVLTLPHVHHLQTRISGSHPIRPTDALRVAGTLHPTPAVGGFPAAQALEWMLAHEGFDRGWYAAPIGWEGSNGDGEFAVGIRSAVIADRTAVVFAGCGIVAGSDPDAEYDETCAKLRQMLTALGVPDDSAVPR